MNDLPAYVTFSSGAQTLILSQTELVAAEEKHGMAVAFYPCNN